MANQQFQKAIAEDDSAYSRFFKKENVELIYNSIIPIVQKHFPQKPPTTVPRETILIQMWEIYSKEYNDDNIMLNRCTNILANQVIEQYNGEELIAGLDPSIMLMDQSFGITAYDPRSIKLDNRRYNNIDYNIRR